MVGLAVALPMGVEENDVLTRMRESEERINIAYHRNIDPRPSLDLSQTRCAKKS